VSNCVNMSNFVAIGETVVTISRFGRHLEKSKNYDTSAASGAILTKFGTLMQFDLLDRYDG